MTWTWEKMVEALERYESEPSIGPTYTKRSNHFVAPWGETHTFFQDSIPLPDDEDDETLESHVLDPEVEYVKPMDQSASIPPEVFYALPEAETYAVINSLDDQDTILASRKSSCGR